VSRKAFRYIAGGIALAISLAGLTACASGGGGSSSSGGKAKLTFAYMGTAAQQASWNKLFAEFKKENPNIDLQAQAVAGSNWGQFFNKISAQIAGGQVPDMIQVATEGQRLFASKGLLEPLDAYIKKDQKVIDEYYADLDPALIKWNKQYTSPGGKTYYLPGEFNTMAMWCNTSVFKAAGASLPQNGADWTWDQFKTAAQLIKQKTGAFAYYADTGYFTGVMPWVLTNGGSSLSSDWSKATFDTPQVQQAATFDRSLVADGLAPKPGGTFDQYTAFAQDKLACFGGGRWPIINIRTAGAVDKTQIVKWPTSAGNGSPVGWNGYPILKASKNKDAAWTFTKFLISKKGSSFFAELGGTIVPARRSVAQGDAFLKNSPVGTDLLYDALKYATPIPSPDRGAEVQAAIEDSWQQMLVGNATPAQGTAKTQSLLKTLVG
jgi:multiple sugar transport system substrate-binding protein